MDRCESVSNSNYCILREQINSLCKCKDLVPLKNEAIYLFDRNAHVRQEHILCTCISPNIYTFVQTRLSVVRVNYRLTEINNFCPQF